MALMSGDLYDALIDAGASEAKARKGAEAVANADQRFTSLESTMNARFATLEGKMDTRFATLEGKFETLRADLKGEMAWIKWIMGTNLVFTLGVLWKLLKP